MRLIRLLGAGVLAAGLAAGDAPLPAAASARIAGEVLHANTLEVVGLAFRDVTARPLLADGVFAFTDIEAKAYRGRISGRYAIRFNTDGDNGDLRIHDCHFDFSSVDIGFLARSLGATSDQLAGRLDGWFELTIPIGNPGGLRGKGELTISEATLVQLPLLVNLLAGNPTAARGKDRLNARFEIRNQRVQVLWARLESPAADLAAEGHIGFDGSLDLQIAPRLSFSGLDRVPLLGRWMAGGLSFLSNRVARASLRGHVGQPQIEFWR